jgi:membrane protein YqaA with SNARE-associated domain
MKFNNFKLYFPKSQHLKIKHAKYTLYCVFVIITQWIGTINKISTILANIMNMKIYVLIGPFISILMGKENE